VGELADSDRWHRIPTEMRNVGVVLGIAILMAATFVYAYTVALGRPFPRHLPIGVVGQPSAQVLDALQLEAHAFDLKPYPTRAAAVLAVDQQQITAVIDASADPQQLLVSSASGSSTARVLTSLDQTAPGQYLLPIVELHPLPQSDPAGLATFYLVIAATILGFIVMFQLRANVKSLTPGRWLACIAFLAAAGGLVLSGVSGPLLGALGTPFWELWLLVSVQIAVAALFNSTMIMFMHRWAIIPTWIVFILLGNTSSGGAVSASLLPQPFAFLNHALPSGASVTAIHSATYFREHQSPTPWIVLAAWLFASLVGLLISMRMLRSSPANR
jgi:hypothetical protein